MTNQLTKDNFEFPRKIIHLASLFVPFVCLYSVHVAQGLIAFFMLFYAYSEWRKSKGRPFFAHGLINLIQRDEEKTGLARAPLFLGAGVFAAITFFSWTASLIAIYQVGFCDTLAAIAGKKWGKTKIPFMARKTYVGSLVFFVCALPVTMIFLDPSRAVAISLVGAFLESLPFKDWDNLTIPIVVGFLAEQYLY